MKNYIKIFSASVILILLLTLLPLILVFRAITDLYCLFTAHSVETASTFGRRVWSCMERLFPVFIIGCLLTSCCNNQEIPLSPVGYDTIVIKTDSCHFYMDSAFYTIDELKIEYSK